MEAGRKVAEDIGNFRDHSGYNESRRIPILGYSLSRDRYIDENGKKCLISFKPLYVVDVYFRRILDNM